MVLTQADVKQGSRTQDYSGQVLVLDPDKLLPAYRKAEFQLWKATGGFGCAPHSLGRAVFAQCLTDGDKDRWNRSDFLGIATDEAIRKIEEREAGV